MPTRVTADWMAQQWRDQKRLKKKLGSYPSMDGRRQFAVVPRTKVTETLARRMAARGRAAGIEIALVDGRGNVFDITPDAERQSAAL